MSNEADLISRLDVLDSLPAARALRQASYDLLDLPAGSPVADVGCGTGLAVAEMAERGLSPTGFDVSEQMTATAGERWPGHEFRLANACDLPLEPGSLAGYRADKVLHLLEEPILALREAHRVLAPGGRIVLSGHDWDAFLIDSGDPALTRTIVHARADELPSPQVARRFRNLLLDSDFSDVDLNVAMGVFTEQTMLPMVVSLAENASAAGAITAEEAQRWIAEQTTRAASGRFFLAVPVFLAWAER